MAKKFYKAPKHFTGHSITTKTHFGSHAEMVVDHESLKVSVNENNVLCKDDQGYYITSKNRLDDGLADPNRYANSSQRVVIEDVKEVSSST